MGADKQKEEMDYTQMGYLYTDTAIPAGQLDVLIAVPFEPVQLLALDGKYRRAIAGSYLQLARAHAEFEAALGRPLRRTQSDVIDPEGARAFRSLTAVTLASVVEAAGLRWAALDPGEQTLGDWRKMLLFFRRHSPRTIAVCTTFTTTPSWIRALLAIIRDALPGSKIVLGGYYYTTNSREFLSLDADVMCVGEGEVRLPQIVSAIADGRSLRDIPGLYLKDSAGMVHTGHVESLDIERLPAVNWRLAERIIPPIELERNILMFQVETQRSCAFKCEYCTFRTLGLPTLMNVDRAVEAILGTRVAPRGYLALTDATATFPRDRWYQIMERLVAAGGAPYPLWAYARVNDIDEANASLMAQAGVRALFVGQESGDQAVLHAMKKGTHVSQVAPAVTALGHHGINAHFAFMHGFPGEDRLAAEATRRLIEKLNDENAAHPTVLLYDCTEFTHSDFATITQRLEGKGGVRLGGIKVEQAAEDVLRTFLRASRIAHAPAWAWHVNYTMGTSESEQQMGFLCSPHRYELFRWIKTVQRGVAMFLQRELEGTPIDAARLRQVRQEVLAMLPAISAARAVQERLRVQAAIRLYTRLFSEWTREHADGHVGLMTRAMLAGFTYRDFRNWRLFVQSLRRGTYAGMEDGSAASKSPSRVDVMARDLVSHSMEARRRWRPTAGKFSSQAAPQNGKLAPPSPLVVDEVRVPVPQNGKADLPPEQLAVPVPSKLSS